MLTEVGKKVFSETIKTVSKSPGWVPLSIFCYVVYKKWGPTDASSFWAENSELAIGLITFILYLAGDVLDKFAFPRISNGKKSGWSILAPPGLDHSRKFAQQETGIQTGIYAFAKAFSDTAGGRSAQWINIKNESAKFIRSLVIPALVIAFWALSQGSYLLGILLIVFAPNALILYGRLKGGHMIDLYKRIVLLKQEKEKYQTTMLNDQIRMFFWNGKFVTSLKK